MDDYSSKGGRPAGILAAIGIPHTGTAKCKSERAGTAITCVNAAGGVTFHLQLPSSAQAENQRIPLSHLVGLLNGFGKFGHDNYK